MERKVLGKGLGALISPEPRVVDSGVSFVDPQMIKPNRYQPRLNFKEDKLQELAASIKEKGIVQPVAVRKSDDGSYELIAGERRLRAVKILNHTKIPVIIKDVNDQEMLELSIIENIQRDDLNPVEEAQAYENLIQDFDFTQEQVAQSVGKSRATVANMLRLLGLPKEIKDGLFKGQLSFGHAKAIMSLQFVSAQIALCEQIVLKGLSVREAEAIAAASTKSKSKKGHSNKDQHVLKLEEELRQVLGTKVSLFHGKKKGRIQIEYYSLNDLERILEVFRK
ncbi:MAG: ParB/RepB/Spo0J family partition protein [Candidatus Omnitrophica bacterium]|nr:ParB/RepB/Spo0J family partition protein [Candidatus Omnitrophota bacterium]